MIFPGTGPYQIPIIQPEEWEPCEFIPFNKIKTCSNRSDIGVHFYIDDYQFERLWFNWKRYENILTQFKSVMSPDFSIYFDWPDAVNIFNHYRKHYIGAYLQYYGVKVYPTICWYGKESLSWCFDGEPEGATVTVSNVGANKGQENKRGFLYGWDAMMERLHPKTVIFYGKAPQECKGNIVSIEPFYSKFEVANMGDF